MKILVVAQGGLLANGPRLPCGTKILISHTFRHAPYRAERLTPYCTNGHGTVTCTVIATVRDRGPYIVGRHLDLAPATCRALRACGLATVKWRITK